MSKSKKIALSIVVTVLLICGGVVIYLYNFTPEARANRLASTYMNALLSNDTQKAKALYPSQAPSEDIVQRNYRLESSSLDKGLYYLLFSFTDESTPSKLRITANSQSITDIATGSSLGKIPAEDEKSVDEQIQQPRCLDKSNLAYLDSASVYARNIRGATMVFSSDSTIYSVPDLGEKLLDRMANFYKQADEKDFVFELKGYRQSAGLSQDQNNLLSDLFQRRATTLQKGLTERGVPLDRINISEKYNYYILEQSTAVQNELYVDINIVNRCIKE